MIASSDNQQQHSNVSNQTRTCAVTRIHKNNASALAPIDSVIAFIRNCIVYTSKVFIVVDIGSNMESMPYVHELKDALIAADNLLSYVTIIPLAYWGRFTTALNAAVVKAIEDNIDYIAFQSLEFRISEKSASVILSMMLEDPDRLVIGPSLPGHEFSVGSNVLRGRTCPWNTFAIWNAKLLALTGFPTVGDGINDAGDGGVEEVTAISLLQLIRPSLKALVVHVSDIEWQVSFVDPDRVSYHTRKMSSKDQRPLSQLRLLNIPPGTCEHVNATDR